MVFCVFSHLGARSFASKCGGRFANVVRIEVLRGVLRQDTVFFDVYPSGVIQERIQPRPPQADAPPIVSATDGGGDAPATWETRPGAGGSRAARRKSFRV